MLSETCKLIVESDAIGLVFTDIYNSIICICMVFPTIIIVTNINNPNLRIIAVHRNISDSRDDISFIIRICISINAET